MDYQNEYTRREAPRPDSERLSQAQRERLKASGRIAFYCDGSVDPIDFGGGIIGLALMFGFSSNWADSSAATLDRLSPRHPMRRYFRLWLPDKVSARKLEVELPRFLATRARKLRGPWYSPHNDRKPDDLALDIMLLAQSLGIETALDEELLAWLRDPLAAGPDDTGRPSAQLN